MVCPQSACVYMADGSKSGAERTPEVTVQETGLATGTWLVVKQMVSNAGADVETPSLTVQYSVSVPSTKSALGV